MPTKKTTPEYPSVSHHLANLGTILTAEDKAGKQRKKASDLSTELAMARMVTLMAELVGKTMNKAFVITVQGHWKS
jgi:hypothetical protein